MADDAALKEDPSFAFSQDKEDNVSLSLLKAVTFLSFSEGANACEALSGVQYDQCSYQCLVLGN